MTLRDNDDITSYYRSVMIDIVLTPLVVWAGSFALVSRSTKLSHRQWHSLSDVCVVLVLAVCGRLAASSRWHCYYMNALGITRMVGWWL